MFNVKQEIEEIECPEYIDTSNENEIYIKQENIKEEIDPLKDVETSDPFATSLVQKNLVNLEVKEEIQINTDIQNKQNDLNETNCSGQYYILLNCELRTTDQSDNLERHICSVCTKEFKRGGNLTQHMLIHTGQRPFNCDQCEYSCRQKSHLKTHKITHSNERPFKCEQCEFSCKQKSYLKLHKLIHSNERPYKCDQCECSFKQKSNLVSHKLRHSLGTLRVKI